MLKRSLDTLPPRASVSRPVSAWPLRRAAAAILVALSLSLVPAIQAIAQDPGGAIVTPDPDGKGATVSPAVPVERQQPQDPTKASTVRLNFPVDSSLFTWIKFFADLRRMNFIIPNMSELEAKKVTIISNQDVSPDAAWEAFLSALEVHGYTLSVTGKTAKIVKVGEASQRPGGVGIGVPKDSDAYVTQLITLQNTRVDDMSKIIQNMAGPEAKIVSYPPTNTLIITDVAANIRKIYKLMNELDVASPRASMVIYELRFASATDVKQIIQQLYGTAEEASASTSTSSRSTRPTPRSSRASRRPEPAGETVSAGDETKFIAQLIEDERTNTLIVLANDDGHAAVRELIEKVDIDITRDGEIHVVYLEHAKAEEVANVLAQLSQEGRSPQPTARQRRGAAATAPPSPATRTLPKTATAGEEDDGGGAMAAFDSGMRIAADESTNSLVIIANTEDFRVVQSVIDKLDVERKQVFVDAVVMELSSEDAMSLGLAAHLPQQPSDESAGFIGAQLGATSLGLTPDALSGLAIGVFGPQIEVPLADGSVLPVPAFGIVLNALKTSGSTNIISNPSLMTLDNEEATIIVGRKIPFPTTSGLNNLGQPVISFQREDVAITMKITPRINSSNYVTLELEVEVQEVEDSAQNAAVSAAGGGFITSQRKLNTVALVADNQTMVIGGLVGTTEGRTESKVPILGDVPIVGALFRSSNSSSRKTNMMIFLTPHIVDEPDDMIEIQRVKEAQRQEFLRRFYGKSREAFWNELKGLLRYSMNFVDEPTMYRGPTRFGTDVRLDEETRAAIRESVEENRRNKPGENAGKLPEDDKIDIDLGPPEPSPPGE